MWDFNAQDLSPCCTVSPPLFRADKLIWKLRSPQRVRTFLWLLIREKILTNAERVQRGMSSYSCSEQCGNFLESAIRVVRDCGVARSVWNSLLPWHLWNVFYSLQLEGWMHGNVLNAGTIQFDGGEWSSLFSIVAGFFRNNKIISSSKRLAAAVMR